MRVELIAPDAPPAYAASQAVPSAFEKALDDAGAVLNRATAAEDAYANGAGSLQNAVYERARADVELAVATSAAQRATQAVQSILNMQI